MLISHEYKYESANEILYIYISYPDKYEFSKEFFNNKNNDSIKTKLTKYIKNNIDNKKVKIAIIVINGLIVGSIAMSTLFEQNTTHNNNSSFTENNHDQVSIYNEQNIDNDTIPIKQIEQPKTIVEDVKDSNDKENKNINKDNATKTHTANKTTAKSSTTNKSSTKSTTTTKATTPTATTQKPVATTNNPALPTTSPSSSSSSASTKDAKINSGTTIKLNTNGTLETMDLEEYIIGVVAAEMPASFHIEALKAQAIAARTFAMKKKSQGITLLNSTSHQVYKNETQLKALWGPSYSTYYNKIKTAVTSTSGLVMTYNGSYIDAFYFSMSNGKTELPSYVWSYSYPYLQCVSSNWDSSLSNFKVSTNINYDNISSKLGIAVNANTNFEILSYTPSGRVEKIKVDETIFTGVNFRHLLGLRSADISVIKHDTFVTFITKGYGHGVGMSQYGANGAAKEGYSYAQILKHYYPGIQIVKK